MASSEEEQPVHEQTYTEQSFPTSSSPSQPLDILLHNKKRLNTWPPPNTLDSYNSYNTYNTSTPYSYPSRQSTPDDEMAKPTSELANLSLQDIPDPIYCTYLCGQSFSDIESWKQHENRDHFAVEKFRCDAPDAIKPGGQCGCVFKTPNDLVAHFAGHGMEISDDEVEDRHLYASYQGSFWCGWCKSVLPLWESGTKAWTERHLHIEQHWFENAKIMDWVRLEGA